MSSKRGIELSVNVLVMIILAIFIFSLGIALAFKFLYKTGELQGSIDEQTKQQLIALMSRGEKVAIPYNTATISKGDAHTFGLGINNILDYNQQFTITICEWSGANCNMLINFQIPLGEPPEIKSGKYKLVSLMVVVKNTAPSGDYVINVKVCTGGPCTTTNQYGTTQQIDVHVP